MTCKHCGTRCRRPDPILAGATLATCTEGRAEDRRLRGWDIQSAQGGRVLLAVRSA
ncbi:hypothetical protein [Nocardia thailandica]|uniref:Uncharacterized protein n=1 Tax=Nocardia thailandica TaxID=257275 RepID=A0ABW6PWU6_9NOCA|nr:hypothetical protein [Nocardia thailandica]